MGLCLLTCIAKKIVTKHFDCHSKNSIKTPQNAIAIVPTIKLQVLDCTHVKWMLDEHNIYIKFSKEKRTSLYNRNACIIILSCKI